MFDFSNLNPEIIAQFWIYFVVSCVGGFLLGWFVRFSLSKRETDILKSERRLFETEKAAFSGTKGEYESLKTKYESLLTDLEKNEKYWLYKKKVPESHSVDPSELLQNEVKNK